MAGNAEAKKREQLLQQIHGARLSSVQFVLNYLILGFDEKGALTTMVWPRIIDSDGGSAFGTAGYRDRLCGLISRTVRSVAISDDEVIRLSFDEGQIEIPLKTYQEKGERVIFADSKRCLFVW